MPLPKEVANLGVDEETWNNLGRLWNASIDLEHFPDHAWECLSAHGQIIFARDSAMILLALGEVIMSTWGHEEQLRAKRN